MTHPQAPCQTQNGSWMPNSGIVWELGTRFQLSALEWVEGRAEAPGLDQEEGQTIQLVGLASKTNHKLVRTHSAPFWVLGQAMGDSDSLDLPRPGLGGSHHLPPSLQLRTKATSKWLFVSIWTPGTLGVHNFSPQARIGTRFEPKLQLSLRSFQRHVALLLQTSERGRFSTFSGQESNCQFDSRPFFCP